MSIYINTNINVKDNSDAKIFKCIKKYKSGFNNPAFAGSKIIGSIKRRTFTRTLLKQKIYKALVLTNNAKIRRFNGVYVRFFENSCILLSTDDAPVGYSIYGLIAIETNFCRLNAKVDKNEFLPLWWWHV